MTRETEFTKKIPVRKTMGPIWERKEETLEL
jgi:hypothetical protein